MNTSSRSLSAQPHHIPTEIIEKIIEELVQREGPDLLSLTQAAEDQLKQCALVSHLFRWYSQQHLFWHMNLDNGDRILQAVQMIQESGRIHNILRSVTLNCYDAAGNQGIFQGKFKSIQFPRLALPPLTTPMESVLLQARRMERITITECSRFAFAQPHLYTGLFLSLPELRTITAKGKHSFPILLLRGCKSLKKLRLDVPSIDTNHGSTRASSIGSEDNPVVLQTLELSLRDRDRWMAFFGWLVGGGIQNQCFLDIRSLRKLTLRGIDTRDAEMLKDPLQEVIGLAKTTLSSFATDTLTQFKNLRELSIVLPSPSFRPAIELFPSILEWMKASTVRIESLIIQCIVHPAVAFAGQTGRHDSFFARWRSVDDAFRASKSDFPSLRKVVLLIEWFAVGVHNDLIREEMPYLNLRREILEVVAVNGISMY